MRSDRLMLAALILLTGCDRADRPGVFREVSDSAGVEVVRVSAPSSELPLTAHAALEIGVATGSPDYELSDVGGALILSTGEVVVADGGSRELRFYDAGGSYMRSQGTEGEGPGEFESLDYVGLIGADTLIVYDGRLLRATLISIDGDFIGSYSIAGATLPSVVGALESGDLVAWQFSGPEPEGLGVYAANMEFGTVGRTEPRFDVVGTLKGGEEGQVRYRGRVTRAFRPFAREGDLAAGGQWIYALSSSADNRIEVWDSSGSLLRVLAVDESRAPSTDARTSAWIASWMEAFPPPSESVEQWWRYGFRQLEPPDSVPLLRSLEVDVAGNVCAERYPLTWQSPSQYWCFTPTGEFSRQFELPPGRVREGPHPFWDAQIQILEDRVVGVWADELGVQSVREFELRMRRP